MGFWWGGEIRGGGESGGLHFCGGERVFFEGGLRGVKWVGCTYREVYVYACVDPRVHACQG